MNSLKQQYQVRKQLWNNYDGSPVEMITGAKLSLNPNCEYSRKRFVYQKSEVSEINFMRSIVRPGDTVIDVGANIGYWTTAFSKSVGVNGDVFSFEPNPQTVKYLRKNSKLNNCNNVTIHSVALADVNKKGKLFISDLHSGNDKLYDSLFSKRLNIDVDIRRLDSYAGQLNLNKISFIKIDVEGYEAKVLKGAAKILKNCSPIVLLEYSSASYQEAGISQDEFKDIIRDLGFCCYKVPFDNESITADYNYEEFNFCGEDQDTNIILKK